MKRLVFLCALLLATVNPAFAACFSAQDQENEQLIRLHSQLMVITLTCRTDSTGVPLPAGYQHFTTTHLNKIKNAERTLMQKLGGGTARLDRLRTEFGNEYSRELAKMSPLDYCATYRDTLWPTVRLAEPELKAKLAGMQKGYKSRTKACKA